MARVVVTGAAGFIGSHVAQHLENGGHEVVWSDIARPMQSQSGWARADLLRPEDLINLTRNVDAVCHIGGIGDVYLAAKDPQLAMSVNGVGTLHLLEAALHNNVSRFLYASTWEVYGSPRYEPIDEVHPCLPRHPYSISKFAGDLLVQSYGLHGPMRTTVLRLGTAYGPRMRENAVIPAFCLKAMRHDAIEIHGKGDQFRQFTHVSDVAEAFRLALEKDVHEGVFNIISPERTTIRAIAEAVAARIPVKILFKEPRRGDVPSALMNATLAAKVLGWTPKVPFQRGLDTFIDGCLTARTIPEKDLGLERFVKV